MGTPLLNKENIVINDTIQIDDLENTFNSTGKNTSQANDSGNLLNEKVNGSIQLDDSDLKFLNGDLNDSKKSEKDKTEDFDDDIIEMRCNSMFSKEDNDFINSPAPKRRKNPFVSEDTNIPTYQELPKKNPKFFKFKSFNELSLSQRFRESPSDVEIVKPIVTNVQKRSRNFNTIDLEQTLPDSPISVKQNIPKKINAFSYLSDGFGGRTKVFNKNDKIMPLGGIKLGGPKKSSFLTKSKVSR